MSHYRPLPQVARDVYRWGGLRALALFAVVAALGACTLSFVAKVPATVTVLQDGGEPDPRKLGASSIADRFSYLTGVTSAGVTIAAGYYVTAVSAHSTAGGSMTITPCGPNIATCTAGSSIAIPAGSAFTVTYPSLVGAQNELGAGSVFVFTGTDSYVITLAQLGT